MEEIEKHAGRQVNQMRSKLLNKVKDDTIIEIQEEIFEEQKEQLKKKQKEHAAGLAYKASVAEQKWLQMEQHKRQMEKEYERSWR